MAITLRDNTSTNTGKGGELTYSEMDANLESFYYSSSIAGANLLLHTTGSVTHTVDLSGAIAAGAQGVQGVQGIQGIQGRQGPSLQGLQGIQGITGTQGIQGAGSNPGGSGTQVQFNDGGSFGGDSGLTYDKTNDILTIASAIGQPSLRLSSAQPPVAPQPGLLFSEIEAHTATFNSEVSSIQFRLDSGTFSATSMPSRIELLTTTDGSAIPTKKLTLKQDGVLELHSYGSGNKTGTAAKWLAITSTGAVIEEDAPVDYVSAVSFNGSVVDFTGQGNAISTNLNISSVTGSIAANQRKQINHHTSYKITVDGNAANDEVILNDTSNATLTLDEINGRYFQVVQDNGNRATLRFGLVNWNDYVNSDGEDSRATFETEGFHIEHSTGNSFNIGVYVDAGTWDFYMMGPSGEFNSLTSEVIPSGGQTRYWPKRIGQTSHFKVKYDWYTRSVIIWCDNWVDNPGWRNTPLL